jgi:hypothetical protein
MLAAPQQRKVFIALNRLLKYEAWRRKIDPCPPLSHNSKSVGEPWANAASVAQLQARSVQ